MTTLGALPPLNQLRVFEATARLLSFTQAGRELHLTQSAVSQQIKTLEAHLGRPLFVRRARSIDLTETGRAYLPVVRQTLDSLAVGTQTIFGRPDEQRITVQVNLSFAIFWLAPRLDAFLEAHRDITVELVTVVADPERTADAADLEIRFAEVSNGGVLLRNNSYLPVCRALRAGEADWRTDTLFDCTAMRNGWRTWLEEQGETVPPGQRVHAANTYAVGHSLVQQGSTLTMTLDTFAEGGIASGSLAQPFEHVTKTPEAYWLLEPQPGRGSAALDTFRSWLLDETASHRSS